MKLTCKYLASCRGCPLGHLDIEDQRNQKKNKLTESLKNNLPAAMIKNTVYDFVFPVFDRYRTRCDFIYSEGKLGWIDQDKKFLPIEDCPLHVSKLSELASLIAEQPWPVKRGSMRLRVSPTGTLGVWLDLANLDIKEILTNSAILSELLDRDVIVEMGQKGKRVVRAGDTFKLTDPTPYPWFKTEVSGHPVDLNSLISSFTQTSPELNLKMIQHLKSFLVDQKFNNVVEFGSGVGNFTLFLTSYTSALNVIENDQRNLIPLRQNIAQFGLQSKISIFESVHSFFKENKNTAGLYFVNPARSGVGPLFDQPVPAQSIVYVSCHLESFLSDVAKLSSQGFSLVKVTLFDQFPHSDHFEILSYLELAPQPAAGGRV
ncbi:MAG: hypothetical protein JNM24_05805 [Bdellovibrionaceae bacterium]|nr:hypothetical protein [Pseudobdellovibrionaceae bacterium]